MRALALTLLIATSTNSFAGDQPNVIIFLADDLGYKEVGAYGQQIIQTPTLDQLARDGMRFTQHYSGSPVCAPSRAALMSGMYCEAIGVMGIVCPDEHPLLAFVSTVAPGAGATVTIFGGPSTKSVDPLDAHRIHLSLSNSMPVSSMQIWSLSALASSPI